LSFSHGERSQAVYAIVRDGLNLPESFLETLYSEHPKEAQRLAKFIDLVCSEDIVRQSQFRAELPNDDVFAMYQHHETERRLPYSAVRLLCTFVGTPCRIVIAGAGFVKTQNQPIQHNDVAMAEARLVAAVGRWLQRQIDCGEVAFRGALLWGKNPDSLTMN
jgi:hypothetical protein